MSNGRVSVCTESAAAAREADVASRMLAHLARLAGEKDRLGRELLQWHEQLNRMFELTAHISQLRDPDEIEIDSIFMLPQ